MSLVEDFENNGKHQTVFVEAEEAIEAFKNGKIIILTDDEERENEGDFIVSAENATPEALNFMVTHGRGLVCVTITKERARELHLSSMEKNNTALLGTDFTVSVDALRGTTTGISVFDRAVTIKKIIDPDAKGEDFGRPGHVFPLIANPGGVLARPGHTEAVVDLAKAAGLTPAGVLCEILDDNGSMARLPKLIKLAEEKNLVIASVEDMVKYRRKNEKLIKKITEVKLPSSYGDFDLLLYENILDPSEHNIAIIKGDVQDDQPVLIRMHSECLTGDTLGSLRCDCGAQLHTALQQIEVHGKGILLYLKQEGRGIGLANKILAYKLQDGGKDTVEANEALGFKADLRDYWFAAQMLKDLGVKQVRLMTNNPKKVEALTQYGIDVVERVPIVINSNPLNERYLRTKGEKLGHLLSPLQEK